MVVILNFLVSSQKNLETGFHLLTGARPHKCLVCERSFITKDTLAKHMLSHGDDRNFKCGKCGKLFKRLGHVREHIRIHSEARPFRCNICEKTFKTNVS